jgi:hypothetical protein
MGRKGFGQVRISDSVQTLSAELGDDDLDLGLKANEILLFDLDLTDQTMVADLEGLISGSGQMELPPDEGNTPADNHEGSHGEKEHGQALASGASPQCPRERDQQGHRDAP